MLSKGGLYILKMVRVAIFIDGANFYYGLKSIYENSKKLSNFNFKKFGEVLTGKRKLIKIFYYNAPLDFSKDPEKYARQQRFFERVKHTEKTELILSRLQKRKIKGTDRYYYVVKGDDIHIAVNMVEGAYENAFDAAVLVSGDGDFIPAVNTLQKKGKSVENVYFRKSLSWHLKQKCDKSFELTKEILDKCFD